MRCNMIENQPLNEMNSWKVGGVAEYFCAPKNLEELKECWSWATENDHNVTVLGDGTNSLISDHGVKGLVIGLQRLVGYELISQDKFVEYSCWAGTPKSQLLREFLKQKLPPAVFLSGLPGNIGGGVVMNAGVGEDRVPREFCEIVSWVEVMKPVTFAIERYEVDQLEWTYRHCTGWQPGIIVKVGLRWPNKPDQEVMNLVRQATKMRIKKQPLDKASCGSVFRNPKPYSAGALIEESGLKGFKMGGAEVSDKHANFIITHKGARASDVHQVIEHVKKVVKQKHDVNLETEVVYMGQWT